MIDPTALRALIKTTLTPMSLYSADAEELLMATCAQESLLGTYRVQGGGGTALGIFQMEPATYADIWANYLAYHPGLGALIGHQPVAYLQTNDPLAIAMARVLYLRAPKPLPSGTDLTAMWLYYKQYYNTPLGAATQAQFVAHYALTGGSAT